MSNSLIKPSRLRAGDQVAAISLSWGGPGAYPHRYEAGRRQLEETFGLQVRSTPHALCSPDWLARNPQARADDLMEAFADPSIRAIISTIGGEDSIRILPYLDLQLIRTNPKIFMGYSDSTITHMACYKAGLGSFYGPSMMAGFAENCGMHAYLVEAVQRTLFNADPVGEVAPNRNGWTVERLDWAEPANQERRRALNPCPGWNFLQGEGIWRGRLLGGCMEVFDWLRGTDFWPPPSAWDEAILFLETSEDAPPPAQLRYTLRAMAALGALQRISGFLLGRPGGGWPPEKFNEYDQAVFQVIREEEGRDDLPIVTGMDFGHTDPIMTLPYGILAEIDCTRKQFSILESAVI